MNALSIRALLVSKVKWRRDGSG